MMATNHKKRGETPLFLNRASNLKLVYEGTTGGVDMCDAFGQRFRVKEVMVAIKVFSLAQDEVIITKSMKLLE